MTILLRVATPLGKYVRTTEEYWRYIVTFKHPSMAGNIREVELALADPDNIRKSRSDDRVYLYYRRAGNRIICVAVRHLNGDGFIITAYFTKKVKEGVLIWQRKR